MKYILIVVGLALLLPLSGWLRRNPQHSRIVWIVMGALPFVISAGPHALYVAVISWATWPGYVKGAEVSLIDLLALAIYISQPRSRYRLPFRTSMGLYFVAIVFSSMTGSIPEASFFYVWQLARMFLVYSIVTNACSSDERVAPALMTGMAVGLWIAVVFAAWQRVHSDVIQASGTVSEKNLFGMMSQFVGIPWFALLLSGQKGRLPYLAPLGTALAAVLTVSRAALGLTAAGLGLLLVISGVRKWTPRKAKIAAMSVASLIVLVPLAVTSLEDRFGAKPVQSDYDERAAFERAAAMMAADNPLGVGSNNYVIVANVRGYNEKAKVAPTRTSLSTSVHNVYLLTLAEAGIFGLVAFLIMLFVLLFVAFHCGWKNRKDERGDLLLGFGVSLLVVYFHSLYEWIFLMFPTQYLFAMTAGMVAGLAQQLGYWQRVRVPAGRVAQGMVQNHPTI